MADIKVAQPWEVDEFKNPVRNTNQDYLKFLNTSYFNEEARNFMEWGQYTDAPPGTPDFEEYWDEQERRCFEGYSVGGVRITGRHYFFLNFGQMKARPFNYKTGTSSNRKIITFPRFLDHQYYHLHELEECFTEGPYDGDERYEKQGMVWAKGRRKGSTYEIASAIYAYNYNFLPASNNILAAYEKEHYATTLNGIHWTVNHLNKNTAWAKRRQGKNSRDHFRASFKYQGENGIEVEDGYMSEVRALSYKDNAFKGIGQCFQPNQKVLRYDLNEIPIKDLKVGDEIMGPDGSPRIVKSKHTGYDLMTTYSQRKGVDFTVNTEHLLYGKQNGNIRGYTDKKPFTIKSKDYLNKGEYFKRYFRTLKSTGINTGDSKLEIDPYFYGLWIGDGDSHKMSIGTPDKEIIDYLYDLSKEEDFLVNKEIRENNKADCYRMSPKKGRPNIYKIRHNGKYKEIKGLDDFAELLELSTSRTGVILRKINSEWSQKKLKKHGIEYLGKYRKNNSRYWQWFIDNNLKQNKHIIKKLFYTTRDERLKFLAGFIDTDGSLNKEKKIFNITQKDKNILEDTAKIARSLGFYVSMTKKKRKSGYGKVFHDIYNLTISGNIWEIPTRVKRKQAIKFKHHVNPLESSIKIKNQYYGEYVGIEVDKDHLFLLDDFTIVHNSADVFGFEEAGRFPNLMEAYAFAEPMWRDGSIFVGIPLIWGTGGSMSYGTVPFNNMFYNPKQYGLKAYDNIYDEKATGECGFFIDNMWFYPGKRKKKVYVGSQVREKAFDAVDAQGNSHRDIAEEILDEKRESKKHGDKQFYYNFISQEPKTPKEAFMRVSGSPLPVKELIDHEANLRINPKKWKGPETIGQLIWDAETEQLKFDPDEDAIPIRNYPLTKDDGKQGAIVIWEHPQKNANGEIPYGVYIAGIDPYSDDSSQTSSLGSFILMNRLTERIVAEYTGKPTSINTFFENCRRLLLYYNATALYESNKKGLLGYFERYNSLHLLAESPSYLREKGMINYRSVGNDTKGLKIQSREVIRHGISLYKEWLNEQIELDDDTKIMRLHTIKSHPILHESIYWNEEDHFNKTRNYDRISAIIQLFIYKNNLAVMHMNPDVEEKQSNGENLHGFFKRQSLFKYN